MEFPADKHHTYTSNDKSFVPNIHMALLTSTSLCKSMPLVRRGLTPLVLLLVRHSK